MSCCPKNSLGFLKEDPNYVLKGKFINISVPDRSYQLSVYVVGEGNHAVIVNSDLFGVNSGLHKRVCDELSGLLPGVMIVMPDYFVNGPYINGDTSSFLFYPRVIWVLLTGGLNKYPWDTSLKPHFDATVSYLLNECQVTKVGVWGFCWGAYVSFRACGESAHKAVIVGSVSCHPSVGSLSKRFGEDEEVIVRKVTCPQLVLSTSEEPVEWKPGGKMEKILKEICSPSSSFQPFIEYHQTHGFVTRGDLKDEKVASDMRDAIYRTAEFLKTTFV